MPLLARFFENEWAGEQFRPFFYRNTPGCMKRKKFLVLSTSTSILSLALALSTVKPVFSLPPPEDIPEEVLRTEIITQARSPVDGKPLTPAEYAQLQVQLETPVVPPQLNPEVRQNIFLLRILKLFRTFVPFLPR